MIASQIILKARQMADLNNSSFISYDEEIQLLNDAYRQVYNDAIFAGEKYFVKQIDIADGDILPNDFFTIQEVVDNVGDIIPRKTVSGFGYDLVNDRIVLKGVGNAKLRYYPKPVYLTYPGKPVETNVEGDIVAYYKNNYVTLQYDDETNITLLTIKDSENNILGNIQIPQIKTLFNVDYSLSIEKIFIRADYVAVNLSVTPQGSDTVGGLIYYDYDGNEIDFKIGNYLIEGVDEIYYTENIVSDTYEGFSITNIEGYSLGSFLIPKNTYIVQNLIYSEYTNTIYFITDDGKIYSAKVAGEDTEVIEIGQEDGQEYDLGILHYDNAEFIYFDLLSRPKVISDQGTQEIKKEGLYCKYGVNDYLAKKNRKWIHFSPIPDTEVSWPNNAYYSYLSAILAYYFTVRAEGNVAAIPLEQEKERFMKMVRRDASQVLVMKDFGYFY